MNAAWTSGPPLTGQDSRRRVRAGFGGATCVRALAVAGVLACLAAGCGASASRSTFTLPSDERPVPIGRGHGYRVPALGTAASRRATIAGLRCRKRHGRPYAIHLELFARRLVVPVPAGIGVAPPQRRRGAYVLGGVCTYAIRTFEPTGVVVLDADRVRPLGDLFAIWGQSISERHLAGFSGPVLAFVDGRRWTGAPKDIPLRRHAEIVLEVGGYVAPHPRYRFPPGL